MLMMRRNMALIIGLGVLVLLGIFLMVTYNSLVKREENVKEKWGNLQTTYQRRSDLIPNLVSVVKASSEYEKKTLQDVIEARAKAGQLRLSPEGNFSDYQQLEQAQGEVTGSMNRAIAIVENYPDLKATKAFSLLQTQLVGTERRIRYARNDFNESVQAYNNKVRRFPGNIAAGILGFRAKEGFSSDAGANQSPEINFKN